MTDTMADSMNDFMTDPMNDPITEQNSFAFFFLLVEASDGGNDEQLHSQRDDGQLKEEGKQWIHLKTHFLLSKCSSC